jgi:hypothetical protein
MIFKFIIYIIAFYFIIRFLRGLFQTNVIIKNYHYHGAEEKKEKEGKIKIIKGPADGRHKSDNVGGDYVEYEDVK